MAKSQFNKELNFSEFPPISREEWEQVISKDLKGADYKEKLLWDTLEGIDVLPFYRSDDQPAAQNIPVPGAVRDWEIRQRITDPDLEEANKAALTALEGGAGALYFDLPTDSIGSPEDLKTLFKDVITNIIGIHFGPAVSDPERIQMITDHLQKAGRDDQSPVLSFAWDPISASLLTGKLPDDIVISPLEGDLNNNRNVAVNAQFFGNAGSGIVDQLAYALAVGNEYLGLSNDPAQTARHMHFNMSTASLYFLEVAKYRALRILWKAITDEYSDKADSSTHAYIHAETAGWNKFSVDPHTNMLRATTEAMSAVIGTCNSCTADRYDLSFAENSAFSSRISRNIQLLLKEESHLDKVSDPAAGSYYIEELTEKLCMKAWTKFQQIEENGGFRACLKNGTIQSEIRDARQKKEEAFKNSDSIRVGINKYPPEDAASKTSRELPLPQATTMPSTEIESVTLMNLDKMTGEVSS